MKRVLSGLVAICLLAAAGEVRAAHVIAGWTFEESLPTTAGPHVAEVGAGTASAAHASAWVSYSNPTGNGSRESFNADNWGVGDYFQLNFSAAGYSAVELTFDQFTSASGGPANFKVQYSLNGSTFTDLASGFFRKCDETARSIFALFADGRYRPRTPGWR